jgi:hypothetical protein
MKSRRKVMIGGVALLVSLSLLLASAVVVSAGGEFKPLAAVFSWNCNSNTVCGNFYNTNTGLWADAIWGRTRGDWGVY